MGAVGGGLAVAPACHQACGTPASGASTLPTTGTSRAGVTLAQARSALDGVIRTMRASVDSLDDLTGDDRAMIYGAMIWMADKLKSEGSEHARDVWTKLGKMAFEMERPANPNDRVQPQPDRA